VLGLFQYKEEGEKNPQTTKKERKEKYIFLNSVLFYFILS
jgi:hypothetical protein